MGSYKEYLAEVEALEAAADAEGVDESALPPFEGAIVVEDELPEMPAPIIGGILLETHKMLLTGPEVRHRPGQRLGRVRAGAGRRARHDRARARGGHDGNGAR